MSRTAASTSLVTSPTGRSGVSGTCPVRPSLCSMTASWTRRSSATTRAPEPSGAGSGAVSQPRAVSRSAACCSSGSGGASRVASLPSTWVCACRVSQVGLHCWYDVAGHSLAIAERYCPHARCSMRRAAAELVGWRRADRDLERELGAGPAAPAGGLAGTRGAGRGVPAGDQGRRRRFPRRLRHAARLCGGPPRRRALERCRGAVPGGARGRGTRPARRSRLPGRYSARAPDHRGHLRPGPGALGVRAERAHAE